MYVDSPAAITHRSARTRCTRDDRRAATPRMTDAGAGRRRSVTAAARRIRLADDAIVSQWLLEQLPSDHRHRVRSGTPLAV